MVLRLSCSSGVQALHIPSTGIHGRFFPTVILYGTRVSAQSLSCVQLLVTLWTIAHQAPLSMRLSQQEYWNGLSFPTPGDLPHLGTEALSPAAPALTGEFFTTEPPEKPVTWHSGS